MAILKRLTSKSKISKGFTFIEVLVTVVILFIGVAGIFRSFLIALNYQKYLSARLHVLNLLSSKFAEAENKVLTGEIIKKGSFTMPGSFDNGQLSVGFNPMDEKVELFKGLSFLTVEQQLRVNQKDLIFSRDSIVYVKEQE